MTNLLKKFFLLLAIAYAPQAFAQSYNDAMTAMQLSEWDKAIGILESITKSNPMDQDAWLSLGSAYLAKGDKAMAQKAAESMMQSNSEGPKGFVALSRIAILKNDMAEADKQIERAVRAAKKDASVYRFLGESFLYTGNDEKPNYARAMEFLKKGFEANSRDYNTLMVMGWAYKDQGRGGDAAQFYEYASMQQPDNPLPLYLLGRVYYIAKVTPKALDYFNKTIAVSPSYSLALRALGEHYYYEEKNYEEAVKFYRAIVTQGDIVTIEDETQLANCLFLTKDFKGCIEQTEKVVKKDNSKTYLRRLLAYCYYETGDYGRGMEVIQEYFKIVDQSKIIPSDYLYLANLQLKTGGDTLSAINNLQKMIAMDTARWQSYKEIGDLNYRLKNYCSASAAYQVRVDSLKDNVKSIDLYYLGLSYFYCKEDPNRYQNALRAFDDITKRAPQSPLGWIWAGKAASKLDPDITDTTLTPEVRDMRIKEFGKGHDYFEKYIEIAGVDPEKNKKDLIVAYEYMSFLHYIKKEDAEALKFIDKLLVLDPNNATGLGIKKDIEDAMKSGGGGGPKK